MAARGRQTDESPAASHKEERSDRDVLLALFRDTEGLSWHNNAGWTSGLPLGEWFGVTTNAAGSVVVLELRYNNLRGRIPAELGELSALEQLHLTNNELYGGIPPELGKLANLKDLRLYCNCLTGSIPPQLGNLHALKKLVLYSNRLSGQIPQELEGMHALEELLLSDNNQLYGDIPAELARALIVNRQKQTQLVRALSGMFSPVSCSNWTNTPGGFSTPNTTTEERGGKASAAAAAAAPTSRAASSARTIGVSPATTAATGRGGRERMAAGPDRDESNCDDDDDDDGDDTEDRLDLRDDRAPHVVRFLDSMAAAWHVVVPIADDVTSVWLLVSTAGSGSATAAATSPLLWWVCFVASLAAGIERVWLVATLVVTVALMSVLGVVRAALNTLSWGAKLCTFPIGTVVCLFCLCFCWGCLNFGRDGPRCSSRTAARLLALLNCVSSRRINGDMPPPSPPQEENNESYGTFFLDAVLWAVVGSRARCSRFWEGLGMSLDTEPGNRKGATGQGDSGGAAEAGAVGVPAVDFGSFIDTWVQCHPFSWVGNGVFGRLCGTSSKSECSPCCYCSSCSSCCCCSRRSQAAKRKPGRSKSTARNGRNTRSTYNNNNNNNNGTGDGHESASAPSPAVAARSYERRQRRRRARVLVRAVGETLVLDGLFLALSAVSGGGWNGSLASIAGISAVFSVLQLLTELRYYVKEASRVLGPVSAVTAARSRDGGG
ncbi:unnamed protein product, partial [Scytosiphon promiscuus]